ncbi:MAG TPA: AAA family ATPase [Bacteroidales bacterium]|jgi:predicted ATP-dependent endonuclease of OLD family|nr:AAA family ATPase [Bacteroidales bacterium]
MKISAFQIKHYRSIIDSGECFLSPDHITSLIGQNESGKTSVLEALKSFYDGSITDDVLRSDLTFPEITCTFKLDKDKTLGSYLDLAILPVELRPVIETKDQVSITRKWLNSRNNIITIAEVEIIDFYKTLEENRLASADKIFASIPDLMQKTEASTREAQISENEVSSLHNEMIRIGNKIEELKRAISRSKNQEITLTAKQDIIKAEAELPAIEQELKGKQKLLEEKKNKVQEFSLKLRMCRQFSDQSLRFNNVRNEIKTVSEQIREGEFRLKISRSDRETRTINKNLDLLKESMSRLKMELQRLETEISKSMKIADKILSGMELNEAEHEAFSECEIESGYATPEMLGNSLWKHIPMFEFFEDFSSLLPNKIDLDDLLYENIHAEGYKAARNFLFVAGLNADFFREENHRILKQKIENLNTEITVDFQDYWRQSVGKDDKIRINFELEHYDNSQPEKSGKPYLEFWIKDKQERLYPKQRSRGVRWFLSFYLELKATAKSNTVDRIMLIDEPGLSLHARAQEDVLKVFEDLRQNLQIIYSTHSPNLIDLKKLYRIIAVQRAKDSDETSETIILDSRSLNEASADTLSPVYALMGTRLNERQFVFPKNNFIVEDAVTFHYMEAMSMLYGFDLPVHFIPASGADVIPTLANLLYGWKVSFGLVMMDNQSGNRVSELMKNTMFFTNGSTKKLILVNGIYTVEDLFSTIDFKRFILKQRVGITIRNSEYIESNKLSRIVLVSDFHSKIKEENLHFTDFDAETRQNFTNLFNLIRNAIEKV